MGFASSLHGIARTTIDERDRAFRNERNMTRHHRTLGVIGLGYVGLPVAVAFARKGTTVVGFDIDQRRIDELKAGYDRTREVTSADLAAPLLTLSADPTALGGADFFIVT